MARGRLHFPKRLKLYESGLNDAEVARKVGVCRMAISIWRWKRGLPSNYYHPRRPASVPNSWPAKVEWLRARGFVYVVGVGWTQVDGGK